MKFLSFCRPVHLTKTQKKGATLKKALIQKIHGWVDAFDQIFVLKTQKNLKTTQIQQMREEWKPQGRYVCFFCPNNPACAVEVLNKRKVNSIVVLPLFRLTFGKNKVVIVALGKKPEDEYHTNLYLFGSDIKGDAALLFTSQPEKEVRQYFEKMEGQEMAINCLQAIWVRKKPQSCFYLDKC